MRDFIDKVKLYEMPGLISGTLDFGLDNRRANLSKSKHLMSISEKEIISETGGYILFRVGSEDNGEIAMIHKFSESIDYYVQYERSPNSIVGGTVTQVSLWRDPDAVYFKDVTHYVFFQYFIPKYGAIMSDTLQTQQGAEFWRRQIAFAVLKGFRAGLVDFGEGTVDWYSKSESHGTKEWLTSSCAWGYEDRHEKLRFVITQENHQGDKA